MDQEVKKIGFYHKDKKLFKGTLKGTQFVFSRDQNRYLDAEKLFDQFDDALRRYVTPEILKEQIKVVYWKTDYKYLITKPVNLNEFRDNPKDVSIPLRNMFNLIGVPNKDIPAYVGKIIDSSDFRDDFETDISKKTTKHINELWKEHNIEIKVRVEGSQCSVHVKDKCPEFKRAFSMEQRSDGFKTICFYSFEFIYRVSKRKLKKRDHLIR